MLSLVGTLGAFIRIRSPIPNRRALFDIGIAGPLAGFVVCLPVIALSVREMSLVPVVPRTAEIYLNDPLLLQWVTTWVFGNVPDGMTVLVGPLGLAAWFGLFLTGLNLIPIGQLDGAHVMYALFRERATPGFARGLVGLPRSRYAQPELDRLGHPASFPRPAPPAHPERLRAPRPRTSPSWALWVSSCSPSCFIPDPIVGSWATLRELLGQVRF